MFLKVCVALSLVIAIPLWSQVAPSVTGNLPVGDDQMQTPPPVSGTPYPTRILAEARSNYMRASFAFSTAYNDNLLAGSSATPINDVSYTIWPTISVDQTSPRMHQSFTYDPGFTFYQQTSGWNEQSQSLNYESQYRLSPHISLGVQDQFLKTSNILNQSNPLSGVTVPASAQSPVVPTVVPFADQTSNTAGSELTYQFARNDMFGGSGFATYLHYPNPEQVIGLYDSNSIGGAGFYNHRISAGQYAGVTYQYTGTRDTPPGSQAATPDIHIKTNTIWIFYTIYPQPQLSFSLSTGPQHYDVFQSSLPESHGWSPALMASMSWQAGHAALAASYYQEVGGGGGLIGAYHTKAASASFQWQVERTWAVGVAGNYILTSNVSALLAALNQGGSSVSGTFAIRHPITERVHLELGYSRLHQNYDAIPAISNIPNSDRVYASISYQLMRPLGR